MLRSECVPGGVIEKIQNEIFGFENTHRMCFSWLVVFFWGDRHFVGDDAGVHYLDKSILYFMMFYFRPASRLMTQQKTSF